MRLPKHVTLALLVVATGGCFQSFSVLSTHTAKTGPDTEADILWVLKGDTVYRCSNTQAGPVCVAVKQSQ
jgi:hypothetical protein